MKHLYGARHILLKNHFRFKAYLLLAALFYCSALPAAAEKPRDKEAVIKTLKKARHFGGRGYGYTSQSLDELSEKLRPADADILLGLLGHDHYGIATGASFGLAALCDAGLAPLAIALETDDTLSLERARDVLRMMAEFPKCAAETRLQARNLDPAIDAAFQRRGEKLEAARAAADAARERHNALNLKLLDPEGRKTLTREERQEIFDANVKALLLDGPRSADQEKLYQLMKKNMLEETP